MDRMIEVKVNGSYITKDNRNAGVQHEANSTSLRIEFDPSWDSYAKKITWWNAKGEDPVEITLGTNLLEDAAASTRIYLCPIPGEPLAECGECTFVIDGYVDGKRQRSAADRLWVKEAPYKETAGQPSDPTPSQAEQLQKEIDGIKGTISQAVASRDAAAESAAQAKASKTAAASSAGAAAKSETAAAGSAASAAEDASAAAKSAGAAAKSERNAKASETAAKSSETTASSAAATAALAKTAAERAKEAAEEAKGKAESAQTAAEAAKTAAKSSETAAAASEKSAQSWAVGGTGTRVGEDTNNAKYWSERTKLNGKVALAISEIPKCRMRGDIKGIGNVGTSKDIENSGFMNKAVDPTNSDSWACDVNVDGSITSSDSSVLNSYNNGYATILTKTPTFADFYNNWTYHKVDDKLGYWTTDLAIPGITAEMDVSISVQGNVQKNTFIKAEPLAGGVRIHANHPPVRALPCSVTYREGTGQATVCAVEGIPDLEETVSAMEIKLLACPLDVNKWSTSNTIEFRNSNITNDATKQTILPIFFNPNYEKMYKDAGITFERIREGVIRFSCKTVPTETIYTGLLLIPTVYKK